MAYKLNVFIIIIIIIIILMVIIILPCFVLRVCLFISFTRANFVIGPWAVQLAQK
jgi:hypothetical protein